MSSPSLASYVKPAPSSQDDGDKTAFEPPPAPPMREISLPFPTPRYCGDFAIHIRRDGSKAAFLGMVRGGRAEAFLEKLREVLGMLVAIVAFVVL